MPLIKSQLSGIEKLPLIHTDAAAARQGHEAQKSGVGVSMRSRLTTIFSTSRDHFGPDVEATCGCVLVRPPTTATIFRLRANS